MGLGLLAAGVIPALPLVVDDLYISYTYALRLLDGEGLTWTTGERVEGYSNLSWVLWLALGRLLGAPATWWAKAASVAAAAALVAGVHRRAPPTWMGAWLVLAVGAWGALATWGASGMETTLFALLLWAGWGPARVVGGAFPMACLYAAALTRPEGSLYLVAAVLLRRDRVAWAFLGALAAYHLARWGWFGALVPNTVLAKSHSEDLPLAGLGQAAVESLVALPIGVAALAAWRLPWGRAGLVIVPVALHLWMLIRMRGDWMGDTRILLPGFVAALSALSMRGEPRARAPRALVLVTPLLVLVPLRTMAFDLRFRDVTLSRLQTPLVEDLQFVVHRIPAGARYETGDLGILSLVPDLRVVDVTGLTDRAWALAGPAGSAEVDTRYGGEDPLACVRRYARDPEVHTPRFRALLADHRIERTIRGPKLRHTWWCREGLPWADAATARDRWLALVDRLPEHAVLRWHAARALADEGRLAEAEALYARDPARGDPLVALALTAGPIPEVRGPRGLLLTEGETARSRPFDGPLGLVLVTRGPVELAWLDAVGGVVRVSAAGGRIPLVPPAGATRFTVQARAPRVEVWVERASPAPR